MKRIAALLTAACLMTAGCSASAGSSAQKPAFSRAETALENGYILEGSEGSGQPDEAFLQKMKEEKPSCASLQYFLEGSIQPEDQEKVKTELVSLIDAAVRHYSQAPYLISRVSAGTAGLPVKDESGQPVSFQYKPYYDEGFRMVIPEGNGIASLYWDSIVMKAAVCENGTVQKTDLNLSTKQANRSQEEGQDAFHLQEQWIGQMLSEGVYPRSFQDQWAEYFDAYLPYLCCPEYFQYRLVPVIAQDQKSGWKLSGWDLVIDLKEPQLFSAKMYQDTAQIRRNAGYLISQESCTWIRSDVNRQQTVLQFDLEGVLKTSWADIEVNMLTHDNKGKTVWSSEAISSRWDLNQWPKADEYRSVIDDVLQGAVPEPFLNTMGIEDRYSILKSGK